MSADPFDGVEAKYEQLIRFHERAAEKFIDAGYGHRAQWHYREIERLKKNLARSVRRHLQLKMSRVSSRCSKGASYE